MLILKLICFCLQIDEKLTADIWMSHTAATLELTGSGSWRVQLDRCSSTTGTDAELLNKKQSAEHATD